ncbi:hypothetical protein [Scleromatobacter humisilvae]|uniref:Uncharacterized protein n=1 Tax=Scleromatobacter humisilvae TaxID=2897159 RepID=A0A9X1YMH1_9BURK|nr:hypothetical protein [Scleromatobacter humisilvae]MCK9688170.1 hypothetical protein [Scleromatobacter humisilvae]
MGSNTVGKLMAGAALALAGLPPLQAAAPAPEAAASQEVQVQGALDPEWGSYRRAYGAAAFFERFTRTRPLIQAQMQVRPVAPDAPLSGLRLSISGAKTRLEIPVDAMGLADIPQLKEAYDEDAVIRLNRPKGLYYFAGRYTIKPRADGVYEAATLREACEQLIDAQRASGYRARLFFKKCAGVKFVYPRGDAAAAVDFHGADGSTRALLPAELTPFEDGSMGLYSVVVYRFADLPAKGQLIPRTPPMAIGTLYE